MSLSPGDKLGPYEIVAQIGAGGMGEVYRAHDPRVGRDVAVKVSASRFGERSEREARAVAALNHPNICALYDVGPNYLVMELVEGEPPKGPLPLDIALDYARQIAEALNAAHEKGIIHRDLKPANIKIRPDGTVKVLDFGLAKIADPDGLPYRDLSDSPTAAIGATEPGTVLGTATHMAPEQARGQAVDKRADIWAFGVVLYEMITGRRAFGGDDVSSIMAAVIQSEPRWDGIPAKVRRLLASCLEKDSKKRLRDIGDAWKLLDDGPDAQRPSRTAARAAWIAAGVLAGAVAIALWAPWRDDSRPPAGPVLRLDVDLGADVSLVPLAVPTFSSVVISPDGSRIAYVGQIAGAPAKLFVRRLDRAQATELAGTERASNPFFSPHGQWLGFWDGQRIAKVAADGGVVTSLGELRYMTGGSWREQDDLIIGSGVPGSAGLLRLPSKGGKLTPIVDLADGESFHTCPQILPGGEALLITVVGTPPIPDHNTIDVVSISGGTRKTLVRGGGSPRYLPSGHLLYTIKATMFAVPFDLERMETRGAAVAVIDDVAYDSIANAAQFDVSGNGTLVYRRSTRAASPTLTTVKWVDETGKQETLLGTPGGYVGVPRISPDGRLVALTMREGASSDIWIFDSQRDAMTRLTSGGAVARNPIWSGDGRHVIYGSQGGLFSARADGAGPPQLLLASRSLQFPTSLSPDGTRLAFTQVDGLPQLWTVPIEREGGKLKAGKPQRFLATKFSDGGAVFSPDGRWIAYASNESGRWEVYVRSITDDGGKWMISNGGGGSPAWSRDGRELMYGGDDRIMSVRYTTNGGEFVAAKPRVWAANLAGAGGFDLAPDGRRAAVVFAATPREAPKQEHSVVFVLNFFDELKRRAPLER